MSSGLLIFCHRGNSVKQHLFIILTIVVGFGSFLLGYSLPPFLEVGFGDGGNATMDSGTDDEARLMRQYEELYRNMDEGGGDQ